MEAGRQQPSRLPTVFSAHELTVFFPVLHRWPPSEHIRFQAGSAMMTATNVQWRRSLNLHGDCRSQHLGARKPAGTFGSRVALRDGQAREGRTVHSPRSATDCITPAACKSASQRQDRCWSTVGRFGGIPIEHHQTKIVQSLELDKGNYRTLAFSCHPQSSAF